MDTVKRVPRIDQDSPQIVNHWLKIIEDRFNQYSGSIDPIASEVPEGQWVIFRNTTTNKTKFFSKWSGTLYSIVMDGTTYAPPTSGTSILKGNGAGGFSSAASGTDYAPATSGSSILSGNGSGAFSNVTVGSGLSFTGGTLSNTSSGTVTSVTASAPLTSSGGATPAISVANSTGTGTNLVTDTTPTILNPYLTGNVYIQIAAPTSKSAGATLTAAEILNGILQYTGAGAANFTTPTANQITSQFNISTNNSSIYWNIIATGAGAATVVAGTNVTLVGSMSVATATSGFFLIRRGGTAAVTIYRLS